MNKVILDDLNLIINNKLVQWDLFKNRTVLIAGANGMLPAYMAFTLLHLNETRNYNIKVIALVRNERKAKEKFENYLTDSHLILLVQDVCSKIEIPETIDYIIHAASQASPKYYGIDPLGTINANVLGTLNLLQLASEKKSSSFLYFSSGEVYGVIDSCETVKEDKYGTIDPLNVRFCYAESKRMGENICISSNMQFGTHARIVRPFHCYGPGMLLDDGRVFADFTKNIVNNENILLRSDGKAVRAFCYITDAVVSFFLVLLYGKDGEAYNIGNPKEAVSVFELAHLLISIYPEKKLIVQTEIIENDMRTVKMKSPLSVSVPDISKLNNLGFYPIVSLKEGFKRTIDSFIE